MSIVFLQCSKSKTGLAKRTTWDETIDFTLIDCLKVTKTMPEVYQEHIHCAAFIIGYYDDSDFINLTDDVTKQKLIYLKKCKFKQKQLKCHVIQDVVVFKKPVHNPERGQQGLLTVPKVIEAQLHNKIKHKLIQWNSFASCILKKQMNEIPKRLLIVHQNELQQVMKGIKIAEYRTYTLNKSLMPKLNNSNDKLIRQMKNNVKNSKQKILHLKSIVQCACYLHSD